MTKHKNINKYKRVEIELDIDRDGAPSPPPSRFQIAMDDDRRRRQRRKRRREVMAASKVPCVYWRKPDGTIVVDHSTIQVLVQSEIMRRPPMSPLVTTVIMGYGRLVLTEDGVVWRHQPEVAAHERSYTASRILYSTLPAVLVEMVSQYVGPDPTRRGEDSASLAESAMWPIESMRNPCGATLE